MRPARYNIPAAFEAALAATIRQHANIGGETVIRVWQNLRTDAAWSIDDAADRELPLIDIRATPPMRDDNGHTLQVSATIEIRTDGNDDADHLTAASMYQETQTVLDAIYDAWMDGDNSDDIKTAFDATLQELAPGFRYGGLTFEDAGAPYDDNGVNSISVVFTMHYSRDAARVTNQE